MIGIIAGEGNLPKVLIKKLNTKLKKVRVRVLEYYATH